MSAAHDRLVAEASVAAQQRRPLIARHAIEQRPQAGRGIVRRVLVSRARHRAPMAALANKVRKMLEG
jgi:hypothetical protein